MVRVMGFESIYSSHAKQFELSVDSVHTTSSKARQPFLSSHNIHHASPHKSTCTALDMWMRAVHVNNTSPNLLEGASLLEGERCIESTQSIFSCRVHHHALWEQVRLGAALQDPVRENEACMVCLNCFNTGCY